MKFGSVCSGIEAASVAWRPLGWEAAFYSEIDPFPCAVLHHHYGCGRPLYMPDPKEKGINPLERSSRAAAIKAVNSIPVILNSPAPNFGDMTRFQEWPDDIAIDLLVGGTPCQSFSIAGFRKGLADPRGNLLLTYLAIAAKYRPRWLVWENVPGVLSSDKGRDFGSLLGGMAELGYGWAYRVLDAQFCRAHHLPFAVPQRRRRVFVIGYLGDWRRAAAVLFDGASLSGDSPPRREAGQGVAGTLAARAGGGGRPDGGDGRHSQLVPQAFGGNNTQSAIEVATAVRAHPTPHLDFESETFMVAPPLLAGGSSSGTHGPGTDNDTVDSLIPEVSPTLRAGGNRTGGDRPVGTDVDTSDSLIPVPIAFDHLAGGKTGFAIDEEVAGALRVSGNAVGHQSVAIPFDTTQITHPENRSNPQPGDPAGTLPKDGHPPAIAFNSKMGGDPTMGLGVNKDGTSYTVDTQANTQAVAYNITPSNSNEDYKANETQHAMALTAASGKPPSSRGGTVVQTLWRVRRLTPVECCRLQGFADDYLSQVRYRGKPPADGPMYKALGNSKATNVVRNLGERIALVDALD